MPSVAALIVIVLHMMHSAELAHPAMALVKLYTPGLRVTVDGHDATAATSSATVLTTAVRRREEADTDRDSGDMRVTFGRSPRGGGGGGNETIGGGMDGDGGSGGGTTTS